MLNIIYKINDCIHFTSFHMCVCVCLIYFPNYVWCIRDGVKEQAHAQGGPKGPMPPPWAAQVGAKGGGAEIAFFTGIILWSNPNIQVLLVFLLVRQGNFLSYLFES